MCDAGGFLHAGAERPAAGERKNSMIHFECDYAEGCHPSILAALAATNDEQTPGYGLAPHCDRARALIRTACRAPEADVHFLVGGTQANAIVIAAALRPHQGALCACTGHINCHETGTGISPDPPDGSGGHFPPPAALRSERRPRQARCPRRRFLRSMQRNRCA